MRPSVALEMFVLGRKIRSWNRQLVPFLAAQQAELGDNFVTNNQALFSLLHEYHQANVNTHLVILYYLFHTNT